MRNRKLTMFQKILICGAFVLAFAFVLLGCTTRPQPMGEDIWSGWAHFDRNRPQQ